MWSKLAAVDIEIKQLKLRCVNNAVERIGRGDKRQNISLLLNISLRPSKWCWISPIGSGLSWDWMPTWFKCCYKEGWWHQLCCSVFYVQKIMANQGLLANSVHQGNSRARAKFRQGVFWFHRTSSQPGKVSSSVAPVVVSNHIHLYKSQNVLSASVHQARSHWEVRENGVCYSHTVKTVQTLQWCAMMGTFCPQGTWSATFANMTLPRWHLYFGVCLVRVC